MPGMANNFQALLRKQDSSMHTHHSPTDPPQRPYIRLEPRSNANILLDLWTYLSASTSCLSSRQKPNSHSSKKPRNHFPFLRLPRELRDEVLSYLLLEPEGTTIFYTGGVRKLARYSILASVEYTDEYRTSEQITGLDTLSDMKRNQFYLRSDAFVEFWRLQRVSRQVSHEAGEIFFTRNTHVVNTAYGYPRVFMAHSRWIRRVCLVCRPSLGLSGGCQVRVVLEERSEIGRWVDGDLKWKLIKSEAGPETWEEWKALGEFVRKCTFLILRRLNLGLKKFGALDVGAVVKMLGGVPFCRTGSVVFELET